MNSLIEREDGMVGSHVSKWEEWQRPRDEAKRQRLAAPTVGVVLKATKVTYLKKWGLEKYRRPKKEKRLRNELKSIALDDLEGPTVVKYRPINEPITAASHMLPLSTSSKVKEYKQKLEQSEKLNAQALKRKRITAALTKQGVRAKYKKGFGEQQRTTPTVTNGCSVEAASKSNNVVAQVLMKSGGKRKMKY